MGQQMLELEKKKQLQILRENNFYERENIRMKKQRRLQVSQ